MPKIIKKFVRYLIIALAVILTMAAIITIVARTPKFQSYMAKQFTAFISKRIGTQVSVSKISYSYFNKLAVYDVLIKDQNKDTLLSVQQLTLKIKEFSPVRQRYRFGNVEIYQPDFRLVSDTSGESNLRWYTDLLRSDKAKGSTGNFLLTISEISLYDGAFQLRNERDTTIKKEGVIDFGRLSIKSITTKADNFIVNNDSVSFTINDLSFSETTGFTAHDLDMTMTVKDDDLFFRNVKIISESSIINSPLISLIPTDSIGYSDFINKVYFDGLFERSMVGTSDLSYFTSVFKGMNESFYLSGDFTGTVAELNGRSVELEYASLTRLKCDFDISGLPVIDNTFAFIDVTEFRTIADDIERLRKKGGKEIVLPEVLHDIGRISFAGNFTGFNTDFVTYGTFRTEKGNFSTDLSFRPDSSNVFRFTGLLKARDIDLSAITGSEEMGKMWFHADMDGYSTSFKHFSANIKGAIDSVSYNNYIYRNIVLNGNVTEKIWDGKVEIKEKNIDMDILGSFNFTDNLPEFNFTLNLADANLYSLNLIKSDSLFRASALLTASFKGNNIDNLDGELKLLTSTLTNSSGEISINNCFIRSTAENGVPLLKLSSDFAVAEVRGPHNYASIKTAIEYELAKLFPTKFKASVLPEDLDKNNFTYKAEFKDINRLNDFFETGISISPKSVLSGIFHPDSSHITMRFTSGLFGLKGCLMNNLNAGAEVNGNSMNIVMVSDSIQLPDKSMIKNVILSLPTHPDTLTLAINWDNKDNGVTKGEIKANGYVTLNDSQRPVLKINILPTETVVNSASWKISPSTIIVDSSLTVFDNILIKNNKNFFCLDGRISSVPGEKLTFTFEGLNLAYLNKISARRGSAGHQESNLRTEVGGNMTGNIELSGVKPELRIESNIKIRDFTFNKSPYGDIVVNSEWDTKIQAVRINLSNDFAGARFFDIAGTYKPSGNIFNLTASLSGMPLNVLNSILGSFASDTRGLASGKLKLTGKISQPMLTGSVMAEDASIGIDILNTRYHFNDSIRFTRKGIVFRNIKITDDKKNQGSVNGIIAHNGFKNTSLDLNCNVKNMMVLNTTSKESDSFYGTAYATGILSIKGPTEMITFNISAKTDNNTSVSIPLNSGATMGEYPYIMFINSNQKRQDSIAQNELFIKKEKRSGVELNLDLEVTPNAVVQLIMDSKTGDIIKGRGTGNLNISMNRNGDMKMSGNYIIRDGNYLFTLGNVINKSFTLNEGGTITWNGGLTDAILDLKAVYTTKASLSDIYSDIAFRNRIDVECQLNLSGKLLNPVVSLGVEAPKANDETREYLKMAVDTEEELSKQFLYLLVMNGFCPDPSAYSANSQSTSQGASALGVTTTEMLSNQFSNWLSQISNDFDIGFTYRPGNDLSRQEVEAAFSTQILNDKVTFNGNVDVGGEQSNTTASNVTTDFTLEYNITDKLKFKAFNRANNDILYETNSPYTQGVGILYRHEFNKFRDLLTKREKKEKNNNKETGTTKE